MRSCPIHPRPGRRAERGAALYTAVFAVLVCMGIAVAQITVSLSNKKERQAAIAHAQRRYLADAGISMAIVDLTAGGTGAIDASGSNGGKGRPFGEGHYRVDVTDNGDNTFTIDSTGTALGDARRLRCVARNATQTIFDHAMFAGNADGDPSYALDLGGTGSQADEVSGDIYSGGDIVVTGDATASGSLRAGGTISGASGDEGVHQPIPDIAGANYPLNHDFDVAAEFRDGSPSYLWDELGGTAWQLPEENPAHIFRLNPSDRSPEYLSTAKDDFFLEDPYEAVNSGSLLSPSAATKLTLTGISGEPGVNGNAKVYFVDGNLWLHNRRLFSLTLQHSPHGTRATFVVQGNIYFSDNLLLNNKNHDGIAFIAIKDPAVPDSGNIYFGDASFGTLERMEAFMYAENNFYDTNLDATGSSTIEIMGIMSAGNQVAIQRDYDELRHTKLVLEYDSRIADGDIELPGLPQQVVSSSGRSMEIISVYEIEAD